VYTVAFKIPEELKKRAMRPVNLGSVASVELISPDLADIAKPVDALTAMPEGAGLKFQLLL
jgi:hypothetical protein